MNKLYRVDNPHELAARVNAALRRASHEVSRNTRFQVFANQVRVSGKIGSYYQKQLAQEALKKLSPEIDVINEMTVER
ncbi:hypothetical protein [Rubinisphaera italica]|uniref:BON domain protein n=1 Tax=Rubinisphaera italica TaxID=2527969 RepID=A0A5C5X9K8_9PLAN|nr:hypothetical protein [Rubinisphaera italica]TWT59389.1 hypothetical protein Pan54_00900 [Rubinisphaera italica]